MAIGAVRKNMVPDDERHTHYMEMALEQAKLALSSGEVPVGCVFVYRNEIIARGANQTNASCNATRHAELVAIDALVAKYSNAQVRTRFINNKMGSLWTFN